MRVRACIKNGKGSHGQVWRVLGNGSDDVKGGSEGRLESNYGKPKRD